ncbi:MAG: outer membrane lipoprotein-sorting protein [Rhodanobacteraceae bacterium]
MRTRWLSCAAFLFAAVSLDATALSLDELLAKNLAARGGADKVAAIKTLKCEGSLRFGGQFELTFVQYQKAPDKLRNEASLQGLTAVQAWDGKEAWQISPFQGRKDPEKMTADDARSLADDAPIAGALIGAADRGAKVEYLGTEDVDGTQAHKLKVTLKNGDIEYVYLDPDHFLEIRTVAQRSVRGTLVETITDYGDYEEVAGVFFPFSINAESKADGNKTQTTIEHAEANAAIDDSLFSFPTSKAGASQ